MGGLLRGRVALITGASGSIGSAVAKRYAAEGASVVLASRNVSKMKALYDSIQGLGGDVILAPIDLNDYESVGNLALSIENKYGLLDILVSAAAVLGNLAPVQECDPVKWKEVMGVNLNANWYLIKHFDALLKQSAAGRAIFVTSEATRTLLNYSYFAPYATSKVALEALVQVYAAETKHSKLCVNMVYPGQVDSGIHAAIFSTQEQSKFPSPEELTDKFVELASPECTVTGQVYELTVAEKVRQRSFL
ncbi:oxidoreductase [Anaplasma phagocytophilum str. MRK]|uniref:SDR family NAD(P)-dependent oxidoreductase n=1 Tax=Anaplasma phagocytophilum TaxID=948 RepID=UPI000533B3CD|nr:SDR family oxidoreductase [Anaplasma phagocytophilum]KDB56561.1 oxidoreductase [Anaplasma phagocytophilum str. MRK]